MWECQRCKSEADGLSQCELCGKLVCDSCFDQNAGTCIDCMKELLDGKQPSDLKSDLEEENDEDPDFYESQMDAIAEEAREWYENLESLDGEELDKAELDDDEITALYIRMYYGEPKVEEYVENRDYEVIQCAHCCRLMFWGESHADCPRCGRCICIDCEGEECTECKGKRDSHADEAPT